MTDSQEHWQRVYATRGELDVSWFEPSPDASLMMLEHAGMGLDTCVIDIGGDSRLVDQLLARGLTCVTVLDVAWPALERARTRLGAAAQVPAWIIADVIGDWSTKPMDMWHDRAVFHFLTTADERNRYRTHLTRTLKAGGTAVIATFAEDGPSTCSGLPVCRYSPAMLAAELGDGFGLVESFRHDHRTPHGTVQPFTFARFTRR